MPGGLKWVFLHNAVCWITYLIIMSFIFNEPSFTNRFNFNLQISVYTAECLRTMIYIFVLRCVRLYTCFLICRQISCLFYKRLVQGRVYLQYITSTIYYAFTQKHIHILNHNVYTEPNRSMTKRFLFIDVWIPSREVSRRFMGF